MDRMMKRHVILVVSWCVLLCAGLPAPDGETHQAIKLSSGPEDVCKTADALKTHPHCANVLLQKYGYMRKAGEGMASIITVEEKERSIREFQEFYKIPVTGILDEETIKYLTADRCGVADKDPSRSQTKRRKRYALVGSKWATPDLTWCINDGDLSPDMSKEGQIRGIQDAFQMWADVSRLTFRQVTDCQRSVIQIKFAVGEHGDGEPFDKEHGTLAHAFFPQWGGDAHFDDDERWSLTTTWNGQKLFLPIATHEFGHSLGLGHSSNRDAIMYALYFSNSPVVKLQQDDINGIQYLYGEAQQQTPAPATPAPVTPSPWSPWRTPAPPTPAPPQPPTTTTRGPVTALCTSFPNLDAMVMLGNGYTWGFSGDRYWRMDIEKAIDQQPRPIAERWYYYENGQRIGMPGNLDAVLFWPNSWESCNPQCRGNTFFFQGSDVYTLRNSDGTQGQVSKYSIQYLFEGLPNNIDAATLWTGNDRAYIFKGNQYWRVSANNQRYKVDFFRRPYQYPRNIDQYWDLGWQSLDSAIYYWHYKRPDIKKTYFFKGEEYVRYNDAGGTIDNHYPKFTEDNWFGCDKSSNIKNNETTNENELIEDFENSNVMDIQEVDIRTGMEIPPEEWDDTSSASVTTVSLTIILMYLSTLVIL